ncbi:hypothetical protein WIW90_09795 [Sulfolobaceae archaeon RB850M]
MKLSSTCKDFILTSFAQALINAYRVKRRVVLPVPLFPVITVVLSNEKLTSRIAPILLTVTFTRYSPL